MHDDTVEQQGRAGDPPTTGRSYRWVWGLCIAGAVLALLLGPLVVPVIGAALLVGGLWARHDATDPRDRTIAGGLAAGGGAIVATTVLVLLFLAPVSSTSTPVGGVVDDTPAEATE
jgi:hypothetical protein